jgi:hypothetical protein
MAWALSLITVAAFFPRTMLITDTRGADLLINRVGLEFDVVSSALDELPTSSSDWWNLGKLRAYSLIEEPFIHFDGDVFLWKPLASELLTADLVVQNPEPAPADDSTYYKPSFVFNSLVSAGGWVPPAYTSYLSAPGAQAFCMGIIGGKDLGLIRDFAGQAEELMLSERNKAAWKAMRREGYQPEVLIEQYLLAAVCYHRRSEGRTINVRHLFPSQALAFDEAAAVSRGYTHLIAAAKYDHRILRHLGRRLQAMNPTIYNRCIALLREADRST